MVRVNYIVSTVIFLLMTTAIVAQTNNSRRLKISPSHRYFTDQAGNPFFWLGDTGWLLFSKLTREEAVQYLEDRRKKGFNVIQAMVLHSLAAVNVYGDSALIKRNVAHPKTTVGNHFSDTIQYDYWDHID